MITCVVHYVTDPAEIEAFQRFAARWIDLVQRHGGIDHGYFLPAEGASDATLALFSFPSLADYEVCRGRSAPEFVEADRVGGESGRVVRYDRTFMRPMLASGAT
jgi:hypothetical protein